MVETASGFWPGPLFRLYTFVGLTILPLPFLFPSSLRLYMFS